jgi:hypothetical protein
MPSPLDISAQDMYQAIGELFMSRGKISMEYERAMQQIAEMSTVITQLRQEKDNGKLVEPPHNVPV